MSAKSPRPPISQLTVGEARKIVCADYLRTLAEKIESGEVEGFDLVWGRDDVKPAGRLVCSASLVVGDEESKLYAEIAEYRKKISVADVSSQLEQSGTIPEIGKN